MSSSVICFLSHNGFLFDLFLKGDVYTRFLGLLQWLILDTVYLSTCSGQLNKVSVC